MPLEIAIAHRARDSRFIQLSRRRKMAHPGQHDPFRPINQHKVARRDFQLAPRCRSALSTLARFPAP